MELGERRARTVSSAGAPSADQDYLPYLASRCNPLLSPAAQRHLALTPPVHRGRGVAGEVVVEKKRGRSVQMYQHMVLHRVPPAGLGCSSCAADLLPFACLRYRVTTANNLWCMIMNQLPLRHPPVSCLRPLRLLIRFCRVFCFFLSFQTSNNEEDDIHSGGSSREDL